MSRKWIFLGLLMLGAFAMVFAGCEMVKENIEDIVDVGAKALTNTGYSSSSGSKTITPDWNYTGADLQNSQFSSDLQGLDVGPAYFSLTFENEQITYEDNDVTVNGTLYYAYGWKSSGTSFTFYLIEYGPSVDLTVNGTELNNVEVDLEFTFTITYSEAGATVSGSIKGNVGDHTVDTTMSVTAPATLPLQQ